MCPAYNNTIWPGTRDRLNGGVVSKPQKFLSFDGTVNSTLSINSEDFNFSGGKKFSVGFWFNLEYATSTILPVFTRGNTSSVAYFLRITRPNSSVYTVEYRSYATGLTNGLIVSCSAACLKGWNFFLLTLDGSNTAAGLHMYSGGIENTKTVSSDLLASGGGMNSAVYPNYVGRHYNNTYASSGAALADLVVFNDELTYDQYRELFFADFTKGLTSISTYSKIIAYYPFCEDVKDKKGTHHLTSSTTTFVDATQRAYLSPNGNNSTAQLNSQTNKFQTITAAIAALVAAKSRYSYLYLENGDYVTAPDSDSMNNLNIIGTTMPMVDNANNPTKLINGTVIKGKGSFTNTYGLNIQNIGFDAGYEWSTNYNSGNATDGCVISGGAYPQSRSNKTALKNITCLVRAKESLFHALLTERSTGFTMENINTYYGVHGIVFKGFSYAGINLNARGHNGDGIIIKRDSAFIVGNISVNGLIYRNINSSTPSAAIVLSSEVSGQYISNVSLLNCDLIASDLYTISGTGLISNIVVKDTQGHDILP